jgi:glycosyltransferase involved in cell wall biosynthesis
MANIITLFNDGEPGLSAARNLGIEEAKGEIIGFVDDDVLLSPDWAKEMVRTYEDETVIGVTGPALPSWEDESMSWLPEEFDWIISCTGWTGWHELREVRNAWGMNMAFRKAAFEQCGLFENDYGFHKGPYAEDNEFSMRVRAVTGKRIVYNPRVQVWHRVHRYRLGWRFIAARSFWIGRSRHMLRKACGNIEHGDVLQDEQALLKRILGGLLPRTLLSVFRHPLLAGKRLSLVFFALSFMVLGYGSGLFRRGQAFCEAEMTERGKHRYRT